MVFSKIHGKQTLMVLDLFEFGHFFGCEVEVEDVDVFSESFRFDTLWDHRDFSLGHLSQEDLKKRKLCSI